MAAAYVGVSPSKFDELVSRGVMPKPKRIDRLVIWDRYQLDAAFDSLAGQGQESPGESDWDAALEWPRSA
jgi:predicted DNA-binding transcriptional regulator AlpA